MTVVSDTSVIRYLVEIDAIHVLPALCDTVLVPPLVIEELQGEKFPRVVRQWASTPPTWLRIETPQRLLPETLGLDAGEAAAISLAVERQADRILIDEKNGIAVIRKLSIPYIRTLFIVCVAAERNLLNLPLALNRLANETQFRGTPELFAKFLHLDNALRALIQRQSQELPRIQAAVESKKDLGRTHDR